MYPVQMPHLVVSSWTRMPLLWICCGVFILCLCVTTDGQNNKEIHIAGLFPMSEGINVDYLGQGIFPAVKLAMDDVNNEEDILPNHSLQMSWNDTECDMAVGTKLFFDMMHTSPPKVMLFGGACSNVTAPLAESVIYWNIAQLSYADTNPLLSDRTTYPQFFRTVPSDSDYNPARMSLLRHFNWSKVGTIFQDASKGSSRYAYAHNKLVDMLDEAKIVGFTQSFSSDPKPALTGLKKHDVRIIIGNFDEHMARKVFCSAYEEHMYGAKYVWIILGDYSENWWKAQAPCSREKLQMALEGFIGTDVLTLSTSGNVTIANKTAQRYEEMYNRTRGSFYSKFHGYAYDGIWVIAKAIDSLIKQKQGQYVLEDFRGDPIHRALNDTNFIGVTGRVVFNNGDRVGEVLYKQFQGGQMVKIGEYNAYTDTLDLTKGSGFKWQGRGPPRDRTLQERKLQRVNPTIYITLCTISGLGILLTLVFLTVNIKFRNHRFIKMSSPNMNNIIIVGCILNYTSVFLLGTDGGFVTPHYFPHMCAARAWVLSIGFTLAFGAMFSKTWRVHAIFTNIKLNKKVIRDYKLFLIVAVLLKVDIAILSAWRAVDPFERHTKDMQAEVDPSGGDIEIIPVIEYCTSDHITVWLLVIYAYKGLLLIFGCFLAWETRHVSIPALNDSKYIGMSVYNVVIMCVSGAAISFVIKDQLDAAYLIIGLFIIFCTTITLCLVFGPKLVELKRDPKGDERRIRATLKKSTKRENSGGTDLGFKIRQLTEENLKFKQILAGKNQEINELLVQLGEEVEGLDGVSRSPGQRALAMRSENNVHFAPRSSQGVLYCDDQASMYSTSSAASLWPANGTSRPAYRPVDPSFTETIELTDIGTEVCHLPTIQSAEASVEEEGHSGEVFVPPERGSLPLYEDADVHNNSRPPSSPFEGSRTPSYQGLKYLSDLYLRETAILSDSEHSDSVSVHSAGSLPDVGAQFSSGNREYLLDKSDREKVCSNTRHQNNRIVLRDLDRKRLRNGGACIDTGFVNEGYLSSLASPLSPCITTLNSPESVKTELSPVTPPSGVVNNVPVSNLVQVEDDSRTSPLSGLPVQSPKTAREPSQLRCDIIEYI